MAQIPDSPSFGERPVPQAGGAVAAYEPPNWRQVGMGGQIVENAGRQMQETSQIIQQASAQQDQRVAMGAANQLKSASMQLEQDPENGFSNVKGNGVIGPDFVQKYTDQFNQAQQGIADSLTSNTQKEAFQQHAEVQGLMFKSQLLQHQAKQTQVFNQETRNTTMSLAVSDIAKHPWDDVTYDTNWGLMGKTVVDAGRDMGLDGDALANWTRSGMEKAQSQALSYRVNGMLIDQSHTGPKGESNVQLAQNFFAANIDKFDPSDRIHLGDRLDNMMLTQKAATGGEAAVKEATAPQVSVLPQNTGGNIVKPYDGARIQQIVALVNKPSPYDDIFKSEGAKMGVPWTELKLRAAMESGINAGTQDSVQGAKGLMQFEPETAQRLGIDPMDPAQAIHGAAILMRGAGNNTERADLLYYGPGSPNGPNTRQYIENGKAVRAALYGAAPQAPNVDQLRASHGAVLDAAAAQANIDYPGNPVAKERYQGEASRVLGQQISAIEGQNTATVSSVLGLLAGQNPPTSMSQLPPALQAQVAQLPGQQQFAIQQHFVKGDKQLDPQSMKVFYDYLGEAANNPEAFVKEPLDKLTGIIPVAQQLHLMTMQTSMSAKDVTQQARDVSFQQAKKNVDDLLAPIGTTGNPMGMKAKPGSANEKLTTQFYGRLYEGLQDYHDQNGKWPQSQDVRKMAATLLTQGKQAGGTLWDSSTRAFQVDDQSKFYVPLPSGNDKTVLQQQFAKVMGHTPTDAELQQYWTRYKMAGGK